MGSKFNAGTAVEALEYDFTDFAPGVKGVIPEPSSEQVTGFFQVMQDMANEVRKMTLGKDPADLTPEESAEIVSVMSDDQTEQMQDRMMAAIDDLTSGQPSSADVMRLPYRVQAAFMAWLVTQFRPEQQAPATKR